MLDLLDLGFDAGGPEQGLYLQAVQGRMPTPDDDTRLHAVHLPSVLLSLPAPRGLQFYIRRWNRHHDEGQAKEANSHRP